MGSCEGEPVSELCVVLEETLNRHLDLTNKEKHPLLLLRTLSPTSSSVPELALD